MLQESVKKILVCLYILQKLLNLCRWMLILYLFWLYRRMILLWFRLMLILLQDLVSVILELAGALIFSIRILTALLEVLAAAMGPSQILPPLVLTSYSTSCFSAILFPIFQRGPICRLGRVGTATTLGRRGQEEASFSSLPRIVC